MAEYIERETALNRLCQENCGHDYVKDKCKNCYTAAFIEYVPAADVLPVTKKELGHLINDTIAYIWGLEARGAAKPEYGYDSRKALLEKLKKFEEEHFPELGCGDGGG